MPRACSIHADGLTLELHVQPNAARSEWAGDHGGRLKLRLASPPVDGRANQELIRFLSNALGIPRSAISIVAGAGSRQKRVAIAADEATARKIATLLERDNAG